MLRQFWLRFSLVSSRTAGNTAPLQQKQNEGEDTGRLGRHHIDISLQGTQTLFIIDPQSVKLIMPTSKASGVTDDLKRIPWWVVTGFFSTVATFVSIRLYAGYRVGIPRGSPENTSPTATNNNTRRDGEASNANDDTVSALAQDREQNLLAEVRRLKQALAK